MSAQIKAVFENCKKQERPCLVTYVTAGYPTETDYVDVLCSLQEGGADIIEVGIPFTDPTADGPTIQAANQTVLDNGTTSLTQCFEFISAARKSGLTVPVVLMGYYNPIVRYGDKKLMEDSIAAQVNGFIIVDLPPEEGFDFISLCSKSGLSYIPLIAPSTPEDRIEYLCSCASSFIYCVSLTGVTGERKSTSDSLPSFIDKIKKVSKHPLAIGFGVSNRQHFTEFGKLADGVVVGSALIRSLKEAADAGEDVKIAAKEFCQKLTGNTEINFGPSYENSPVSDPVIKIPQNFRFGDFGGRYASEILVPALTELDRVYREIKDTPEFMEEFRSYYQYIGRPSSCHLADRLTAECGGAQIWLKREDLNHTGAHKINNAVGQMLIAKRLGKKRIIAETGAGQHGVATATVCAKFGYDLTVYMGAEDVERQALNVFRMQMLGAKVVPVESGARTLKDAINEAMRDWVTNIDTTHYLIGSAIGPHPFPEIVRDFQSVIGLESKQQMTEQTGRLPDYVLACVGGGSNAIGLFHPYIEDKFVNIVGIEAGGSGVESGKHSATLVAGVPGVLHGTRTYVLQDNDGQIIETHSISAGLDYPGVGPEHAWLKDSGRASYVAVTDKQALEGFLIMSHLEGIIPALETSHAIYHSIELAKTLPKDKTILVCISGRGDKDVDQVRAILPKFGLDPTIMPKL